MHKGVIARHARQFAFSTLLLAAVFASSASAALSYETDFESATALTEDSWQVFVNYFTPDCATYQSSPYGFPAGDNGPQAAALAEGGASQVLNVFSNYDDGAHATTCLETNVFVTFAITAEDAGDYSFAYQVENPPEQQFIGSKVNAFVRIFNSDFSAVLFESVVPSTPGPRTIEFTVDSNMAGGAIQLGFNNYAFNFEASGMYYDNLSLAEVVPPPPPPDPSTRNAQPIPSTSATGNGILVLLLGLLGAAAVTRRLG